MVNEELYKEIVMKMMEHNSTEDNFNNEEDDTIYFEDEDFKIMMYLFCFLDDKQPREIKNSRIAHITSLSKSTVKESINRLGELGIIEIVEDKFNFGLRIVNPLENN